MHRVDLLVQFNSAADLHTALIWLNWVFLSLFLQWRGPCECNSPHPGNPLKLCAEVINKFVMTSDYPNQIKTFDLISIWGGMLLDFSLYVTPRICFRSKGRVIMASTNKHMCSVWCSCHDFENSYLGIWTSMEPHNHALDFTLSLVWRHVRLSSFLPIYRFRFWPQIFYSCLFLHNYESFWMWSYWLTWPIGDFMLI